MNNARAFQIAFQLGARVDSTFRRAFNTANDALQNTDSGTQSLGKSNGALRSTMSLTTKSALAAGAAFTGIATGLGTAVKAASDFNGAMKQVQAATGSSTKEMKEIKEISKNLYNKNLGEDWNDLAASIQTVKSVTDLSGGSLETATKYAIQYRDVWGEDVSQSIKASDTMMRNFGINAEQSYNLLAQGAQKGLNKSDELIDSANEYAPYFKTLGFSANGMFDVFSTGLKNGAFNLDKVGDAIKEFNIRSKDGSKASIQAYKDLGFNAEKMTNTFAKGGPSAQKAFKQVVDAIAAVKSPAEQNAIAVSLFGTQAEDLEMKVIKSFGNVKNTFDMTKQTMEEVGKVKYDTLGNAIKGIGRQFETGVLIPVGERILPFFQSASDLMGKHMKSAESYINSAFKGIDKTISYLVTNGKKLAKFIPIQDIKAAIIDIPNYFSNLWSSISPYISQIASFFQNNISKILAFWNENGSKIVKGFRTTFQIVGSIISGLGKVFGTLFKIVSPVLNDIVDFAMSAFSQILDFWNENGPAILKAVQNLFSGINAIIQFLSPVILFIVNSVWGNVKGLIQGALNVIMGIIKIFAGLFTGDFSKMWSGVKQLFLGSIQAIWNFVNLLFVGKILGGIKNLATMGISKIGAMWSAIKGFFSGGSIKVWQNITDLGPKLGTGFSKIKDIAVNFAKSMWEKVSGFFSNIVTGARELPGKIGSGISSMAEKAVSGAIKMGNKLIKGIGKVVNGVIKGVNWVMAKVGIDVQLNEWEVPQYAKGTKGHPGGLAILGDGGGPELFRTPSGFVGMSPGTDTLMNLPRGTEVIPHKDTKQIMDSFNLPAYKEGTGVVNALKTGWNWLKDTGSKVKDISTDVFSYITEPTKLMNKVLEQFGVTVPSFDGAFGDIAKGSFNTIKEKAISFVKDKLTGFSNWNSGGSGASGDVTKWLTAAINITGVPMSWLGPLQTMAMKESGGNPRAINLWDSNFKAGHPSKGLLQTIDSTFSAYKLPGMDDIWNPIHNAVASIRYTLSRYGSIFNTPGIASMANGGGYKGYYKGGKVPNTQYAWVGERGPELLRLPGGSTVHSNGDSQSMIAKMVSNLSAFANGGGQGAVIGGSSPTINLQYSPNINIGGNADSSILDQLTRLLANANEEVKRLIIKILEEHENDKKRRELK